MGLFSKKKKQGESKDTAVKIYAKNSFEGIAKEYAWIKNNHGAYTFIKQKLVREYGKSYDVLTVKLRNGKFIDFWFDISSFHGKF
ncbi:MAG: hypothetical protein K9W44_00745 [Candidatus Lokiarchaeota archaeon]|nr:hypothetical protein [Candidatus Harpocratesius repetitus]